jgi:hypothetical protein
MTCLLLPRWLVGSGVPIGISGFFFTLSSKPPTIFSTGATTQLSTVGSSASSRGFV